MEDQITLSLIKPVKLGDNEYSTLELREPTAGEMSRADKAGSAIDSTIALIYIIAKVPKPVVDRLCQRDFEAAASFLGGFTLPGPQTGETS